MSITAPHLAELTRPAPRAPCQRRPRARCLVNASSAAEGRHVYWGSGGAPGWRVLATLVEMGLPYESRLIEFSKRGHKGPEVTALNPRGQVPVFVDEGGIVISESLAVLDYLERAYPEPPLTPSDKAGYAMVLQRLHESVNLQTPFRDVAIAMGRGAVNTPEEKQLWQAKVAGLQRDLGFWEGYVGEGGFVAGPAFSLADLAVAPFLLAYERFGATYEQHPRLRAYVDRMKEWPSIAQTWPPHWKESPAQSHLTGHL